MKNQFINECSGITPDGVDGVVVVGILCVSKDCCQIIC